MPLPIRVLIVEDSEDDVLLMIRELRRSGYAPEHAWVDDAPSMMEALGRRSWDVVLSDYWLPRFNALRALDLLHRSGQDIPFIVVSGAIGEDLAVDAMRAGARDFFSKSVMARLGAAIHRELLEAARRRERAAQLAEAEAALHAKNMLLQAVVEGTTDAVFVKDRSSRYLMINSAGARFFGREVDDVIGRSDWDLMANESADHVTRDDRHLMTTGETITCEHVITAGGVTRTFLTTKGPYRNDAGEVAGVVGIARDMTERKLEIQAAIEARDMFLSIASHELRTPLTPLRLQVDSLKRVVTRGTPDDVKPQLLGQLSVMDRQVTRLSKLVDDLLSLSLIASNRLRLDLEPTDLSAIAREAAERIQPVALRVGSPLVVRAGAPVTGLWDRMRLDQVVTNLLDNAVKYGAGRPVEVAVDGEGEEARLTVRDEGIGIAPESQARIFQRFERAVSGRHYGGFGLGLWIVRQIVDALGGTIQVKSRTGAGTTFTVVLPRGSSIIPTSTKA